MYRIAISCLIFGVLSYILGMNDVLGMTPYYGKVFLFSFVFISIVFYIFSMLMEKKPKHN